MSALGITETGMGQARKQDKPGMDTYPGKPGTYPNAPVPRRAGQGRRPVDPYADSRAYPAVLSIRLTHELRDTLNAVAERDGVSASSYVRNLVADACGNEAPIDRQSGRRVEIRIPPEEMASAATLLCHVGRLVAEARGLSDGQATGAVMALESAYNRIVRLIETMER